MQYNMYNKRQATLGSNAMTTYTEGLLKRVHKTSAPSVTNSKERVLCFIVGAITVIFLPYLHIGIFYMKIWVPNKPKVNLKNCTCSCFDTIFRGEYEDPGMTRYKSVYFNSTWRTMQIWIITVVFILLMYESIKYLVPLFRRSEIRWSMFALYVINLYPNYYSWWSFFSYINETFFQYFYHDMWFALTELISTGVVLQLCHVRNDIVSWKVLVIVNISLMHVFVSGLDQFITQNLYGAGQRFHMVRNFGLMTPDLVLVIVAVWELVRLAKKNDKKWTEIFTREEIVLSVVFVSLGSLLGKLL